ncbi:MAG: sugar ABC transporter permease [Oscillospiraceae bacterium]|nr:sugar ABC transporter permease [Oscillospiraceae bacterium]
MRRPIQRWFPLFILPTFLCFCIGFIWPFLQGIYLSFCSFNTPRDAKWVGFGNYVKAFSDAGFSHAFWNTAGFAVISIVLINLFAFFIAYALTQKLRGANLFRTVFFMPNLIGGVVLGYIWSMIFDAILRRYGTYLTANATYGFWGLVILVAWQQIGYMMIIYIAGLQSVPGDMLEAAKIDGATGWQTLTKVIIPNVMPSITICTFLTLTNSFKLFDQNLALTGGAPQVIMNGAKVNMTELLALNIYSTYNISKNWHGAAQAKAVVFFILVAVLAIAQQTATRSKEVQQ